MKKIIICLSFVLIFSSRVFAACDYSAYCPVPDKNAFDQGAQFLAQASGANFLAEQVAQNIIKEKLKKLTNQDFDAEIKAFTPADLMAGKFKSLSITGKNLNIMGFFLTSLSVKTVCDYNSVNLNPFKFNESLIVRASAEITEADIKNTLIMGGYINKINSINLSSVGFSSSSVDPNSVSIRDNKLYFTLNAITQVANQSAMPLSVLVGADINVSDGRFITSRIDTFNLYNGFDLTPFSNLLNSCRSLSHPIYMNGQQMAHILIENIRISGDRIFADVIIFLPKNA